MFRKKTDRQLYIEERNKTNGLLSRQSAVETASAIAFVTMAESGAIDDVTATENIGMFAPWQSGITYEVNALREYEGNLYRCIQSHTSQENFAPDVTSSLWKLAGDPSDEYPQWSQPVGAFDAYSTGDRVTHNENKWVSTVDNNVWEPGAYGWEEV